MIIPNQVLLMMYQSDSIEVWTNEGGYCRGENHLVLSMMMTTSAATVSANTASFTALTSGLGRKLMKKLQTETGKKKQLNQAQNGSRILEPKNRSNPLSWKLPRWSVWWWSLSGCPGQKTDQTLLNRLLISDAVSLATSLLWFCPVFCTFCVH